MIGDPKRMLAVAMVGMKMLVAASVAAALVLGPHPAHTQVTDADATTHSEGPSTNPPGVAKSPRPEVKRDGTFAVEGVNYEIDYYFQEGKSYQDEDAHVYYAPAFHLTVEEDLSIRHHIDEGNGSLTLYFQRAADSEATVNALRGKLLATAKKAVPDPIEGERKYRIGPLLPDYVVFRSTKAYRWEDGGERKKLTSERVRGVDTQAEAAFAVHFYDLSRGQAERFVNELQEDLVQIEFRYAFEGVSDETCIAKSKDGLDQSIDLFKESVGEGREGYVSRHQVVEIADRIAQGSYFSVRCADFATAAKLMEDLVAMLGKAESIEIADWNTLDDRVAFDGDSFKADVTDSLAGISNERVRDILESAMAEEESSSSSRRFGVGGETERGGGFVGGFFGSLSDALNVNYGSDESEAKSEAASTYVDLFKDKGVSIHWDGEKLVPKSVDVHTVADLRAKWGRSIELEYNLIKDAPGRRWMRLSEMDRSELLSREDLDALRAQVWSAVARLGGLVGRISEKMDTFGEDMLVRMEKQRAELLAADSAIAVFAESYDLKDISNDVVYHNTGIPTSSFPLASIAHWERLDCNYGDGRFRLAPDHALYHDPSHTSGAGSRSDHTHLLSSIRLAHSHYIRNHRNGDGIPNLKKEKGSPFLRAHKLDSTSHGWMIVVPDGYGQCKRWRVHVIYWPRNMMLEGTGHNVYFRGGSIRKSSNINILWKQFFDKKEHYDFTPYPQVVPARRTGE